CTARSPKCEKCGIQQYCRSFSAPDNEFSPKNGGK
ncbi:MAG: endonuclease III, partial [Alistipes sp.]|nr:endonuclease III [Alistipes sp.]